MKLLTNTVLVISMSVLFTACGDYSSQDNLIPGPSGAPGAVGAQGSQGVQGVAGQDGTNGTDGSNGSNGADGIGATPGISCAVYNLPSYSTSTQLPEALIGNPIVGNFILPAFNIPNSLATNGFPGMPAAIQNVVGFDGYALDCNGYLNIVTTGDDYVFQLLSDDGSVLYINDVLVINNQGEHSPASVSSSAMHLDRGLNKINIVYFQGPLTQIALQLSMAGANFSNQVVPASLLTH